MLRAARARRPAGLTVDVPALVDQVLEALGIPRVDSTHVELPAVQRAWQAQWDACSRLLVDGVPLGPIHQPTWVVHGTLDRVVPVENAAAIKRRIPHATVTELPGAGHLCWLERPDEVNALILDAL